MDIKIVISIGVVIGALSIWNVASPFFNEAYKGVLKFQGECANVALADPIVAYESDSYFLWIRYCNEVIPGRVINKGKNVATNMKIKCFLRDSSGIDIGSQEKTVSAMQINDVQPFNMVINYNCGYKIENIDCAVSFEDPCQ